MELCWRIYGPLRTLSHTLHYICFYVFFIVEKPQIQEGEPKKKWKNSLKLIDIHVISLNITDFMVALSFVFIFYFSFAFQACANHPLLLWYLSFSLIFSHLMFLCYNKTLLHLSQCLSQEYKATGYFKIMFYSGVQTFFFTFLTLFLAFF